MRRLIHLFNISACWSLLWWCAGFAGKAPAAVADKYLDPSVPLEQRVDDLVGRMTLEEKVSQMQNRARAIPRLQIPEYDWWNEGLHGIARSGYATVFPQAIGMAAAWDPALMHDVASTISTEARAKYNQAILEGIHSIYFGLTIWSPNINIFRDPRWGRGQETYGEDPYLTGRLAAAFVRGLQGDDPRYWKTIATPKHFAVHSGPESDRHRFNVQPSAFDLEDTYLPAFRAAVTEGGADSLMCAYNAVDSIPACANRDLLADILRRDWKFPGYVTSDCGAVSDFFSAEGHKYSADAQHAASAALKAGTDTSCGDEYAALVAAVHAGLVSEEQVNQAVKRLFRARFQLGMFDPPASVPYSAIPFAENDSAAHRALALRAANESMVLLKNDRGVLPLGDRVSSLAVIGPNAASLAALEGNYNAVPSHPVLPLDGIATEFGPRVKIPYAQGAPYADGVSLPVPRTALHPGADAAEQGLTGTYFANSHFAGAPALTRIDREIDFDWNAAAPAAGIAPNDFSVRWSGTVSVPQPGDYAFDISFSHCYPCSDAESYAVSLDGKPLAALRTDESKPFRPSRNPAFHFVFSDTRPHTIRIDYAHHSRLFGAGLTLNWQPPAGSLLEEAVATAKSADVVVCFVGLSPELEGEEMPVHVPGFAGGDRTDIGLPAVQQHLLEALYATGKPLVVVLMNGSALAVSWAAEHAAAVVEAWYPGEAGGQAVAETLAGKNNPAGRLPVTFYASTDQLSPFRDYSMKNRTYRFFQGQPLYAFGYGLSYAHFSYSALHLSTEKLAAGESLEVEAEVQNDAALAGNEVTELYLAPLDGEPGNARLALRGFGRESLAPGERKRLHFTINSRQLSQVATDGSRAVRAGNYAISLGGRLPEPGSNGVTARFAITGTQPLPR